MVARWQPHWGAAGVPVSPHHHPIPRCDGHSGGSTQKGFPGVTRWGRVWRAPVLLLPPPSPKRFSGPFPLCIPRSGRGVKQLLLSTAFWGNLVPTAFAQCGDWQPCRGPPPSVGPSGLGVTAVPPALPFVQLITSGGHYSTRPLVPSGAPSPPPGVRFGAAEPLAFNASMCLGTPCLYVSPPAIEVPGGGGYKITPSNLTFFPRRWEFWWPQPPAHPTPPPPSAAVAMGATPLTSRGPRPCWVGHTSCIPIPSWCHQRL